MGWRAAPLLRTVKRWLFPRLMPPVLGLRFEDSPLVFVLAVFCSPPCFWTRERLAVRAAAKANPGNIFLRRRSVSVDGRARAFHVASQRRPLT